MFWAIILLLVAVAVIAAGIPSLISWRNTENARFHALSPAQQEQYLKHNSIKLAQLAPTPVGVYLLYIGITIMVAVSVVLIALRIWQLLGRTSEETAARLRLRRAEQQLAQQLGVAAQLKFGVHRVPPLGTTDLSYAELLEAAEVLGAVEQPEAEQLGSAEREVPLGRRLRAVVETPTDAEERLVQVARDSLTLPALWEVTHSRLDLYHQIATGQARRSFVTAQVAIGAGFVLLIVFAILAVQTHTTAGAITTGALGAVSAALAGYISRTFVRSQESAAAHLRAYFDQPLEFSKYLAAERLLASNAGLESDQHSAILTALVQAIVTPHPSHNGKTPQSRHTPT